MAVDDDACPGGPHVFFRFGLPKRIHFSSPVFTVQKPLPFCLASSCSLVKNRHSMSLGFNPYGTQCPCFFIISNAFKRLETAWRVIQSSSASWSSILEQSKDFRPALTLLVVNIEISTFEPSIPKLIEQYRRKLHATFDEPRSCFSSNESRICNNASRKLRFDGEKVDMVNRSQNLLFTPEANNRWL